MPEEKKKKGMCFVVGPIGQRGTQIYEEALLRRDTLLFPSAEANGLVPKRADDERKPGRITSQMLVDLHRAEVVLVDLWPVEGEKPNPNVMYELGIRHAFNKPTVCLKKLGQVLPFDVGEFRCVEWDGNWSNKDRPLSELIEMIKVSLELKVHEIGSPVWEALQTQASTESLDVENPQNELLLSILKKVDALAMNTSRRSNIQQEENISRTDFADILLNVYNKVYNKQHILDITFNKIINSISWSLHNSNNPKYYEFYYYYDVAVKYKNDVEVILDNYSRIFEEKDDLEFAIALSLNDRVFIDEYPWNKEQKSILFNYINNK